MLRLGDGQEFYSSSLCGVCSCVDSSFSSNNTFECNIKLDDGSGIDKI